MHKLKDVNQPRLQFKDLTVPDFPDIILQELFVLFKIACICTTDADAVEDRIGVGKYIFNTYFVFIVSSVLFRF